MKPAAWIVIASIFGFLGVALGAFGAHALQDRFGDYEKGIWQTAVQYHLLHAVVLLAFGLAVTTSLEVRSIAAGTLTSAIGWFFTVGILVFSGSLYALALTGTRILGAITPIGGVAFILAWLLTAWAALRAQ